jgi:hypothetical protein
MFLPKILGRIVPGLSQCQHYRYEDAPPFKSVQFLHSINLSLFLLLYLYVIN